MKLSVANIPAMALLVALVVPWMAHGAISKSVVFVSGTEGYHTFRIPALAVARDGTVLAFAEGRVSPNDHARNDIVLKRSADGGVTWSPLEVVADDGNNSLNNPCVVVLRDSGRVLLMYQRYPRGKPERRAAAGYDPSASCLNFLVFSDDDGRTWSAPRDISRSTKRPTIATSIASGPGNGIELRRGPHAGRIVFPFNQGPWGDWHVYAVYSDDRGDTWSYGEIAPRGSKGVANEVQMVELSNGDIRLNARSHEGRKQRKTATSEDGGESWDSLVDVPDLLEPQCNASLLRVRDPLDGEENLIAYCGPMSETERVDGTVFLSGDDGETWPRSRLITAGHFGYSALARMPDGSVGCLYETGEKDYLERIEMKMFTPDWVGGE